ncbi:MAG TPA: GNAT family N-acetyltransferase, partial [Yinghuangia sp.]|nr:GNAT family N-acetyltransferase [Yinghuangia sp.]
ETCGVESWRDNVEDLASQAENEHGDHWILQRDDGRIIGTTTVQKFCPPWGWTAHELAEQADYLYTTITDPEFRAWRPGTLIAWWAVDRAAREGTQWVRRGCVEPRLRDYYRTQGFEQFHEVQKTHNRFYLMGRRAEPLPELPALFADPGQVTAAAWR